MVSSSGGNPTTHVLDNQIQGFVSASEMFNLTSGMDLIGFSRNLHQHSDWKSASFLAKPDAHHPGPSSSTNFYHHDFNKKDFPSGISGQNLLVGAHDWQHNRLLVDDSSSLRCAFPCEPDERPTQGLSLSLCSTNPSGSIGLQCFELTNNSNNHMQQEDYISSSSREVFFGKSPYTEHGYFGKTANLHQENFLLKNSKYLLPAQQLLKEFCSLETKQSEKVKQKSHKSRQLEVDNNSISPSKKHPVTSLDFVELQKRKTKLFSMLEEVDRRYGNYCNQMKAVVSSFEAVVGNGAATVYSSLALKAMSRHFKCLKDGIMGQLQDARKAMGEKDGVTVGATRGETPRLKVIDQAVRQERAFQQMGMMESHPWRPQRGLPERSVTLLRAWLFEHFLNPYPSDADKHILARQTGLSRSQVSNWFINARVRLWKPMIEEMYVKEVKEQEDNIAFSDDHDLAGSKREKSPPTRAEDEKATAEFVCTTSSSMNNQKSGEEQCLGMGTTSFGSGELDFSAYRNTASESSGGMVGFSNENYRRGGVCLTLGLQQDDGGSKMMHEYEAEAVQYSLLEGQPQSLPSYSHFMASHLLHDLAG